MAHSPLEIQPLHGGNYQLWEVQMRSHLHQYRLWSIVTGEAKPQPPNGIIGIWVFWFGADTYSKALEEWFIKNQLVRDIIRQNITHTYKPYVIDEMPAQEVWEQLRTVTPSPPYSGIQQITWKDGTYIGELNDRGQPHGDGEYKGSKKLFKGMWVNGLKEGWGVEHDRRRGCRCEGIWLHDEKHGVLRHYSPCRGSVQWAEIEYRNGAFVRLVKLKWVPS